MLFRSNQRYPRSGGGGKYLGKEARVGDRRPIIRAGNSSRSDERRERCDLLAAAPYGCGGNGEKAQAQRGSRVRADHCIEGLGRVCGWLGVRHETGTPITAVGRSASKALHIF